MSNVPKKEDAESKAPQMSSQMQAVVRLLAGQEERTIAQKLADSNRPTWEQYKKDNEDKLNLEGMDQKKMEEYRAQLDKEREQRLARGTNHKQDKKKKSKKKKKKRRRDDSSRDDSDSEDSYRRHKKHKKKRKRKHRRSRSDDSSSSDSESSHSSSERAKNRKHKHKKRKKKDKKDDDSDGSHYRLSKFFDNDSS